MGGHSTAGWYVYMIRTAGGRLYTGITTDVTRRWREHCAGKAGAKFFRSDRAEALCLVEGGLNRSTAAQREAQIKKLAPAQKWRLVRCQGPVALVPPAVEATK
ncbi:GIY-YIG nuclease family protein [Proteobacteria bacterium 005FR1]|nr:GIY-YIG nuclease family protein [Proteobacteria bacterium 005FR1]